MEGCGWERLEGGWWEGCGEMGAGEGVSDMQG